jgi:hypothetical protein
MSGSACSTETGQKEKRNGCITQESREERSTEDSEQISLNKKISLSNYFTFAI